MTKDTKMTDILTPEDVSQHKRIKIGGVVFVRTPHAYTGKADCPICGGLGMPWAGWFSCEDCGALALVTTGTTYVPYERQMDDSRKVELL